MNLKSPTTLKRIALLTMLVLSCACSSISLAKKLHPRTFRTRTYRPCTNLEVSDNVGKLCYRYCAKKILWNKCAAKELIIEDLKDDGVWQKFIDAGFIFRKRSV